MLFPVFFNLNGQNLFLTNGAGKVLSFGNLGLSIPTPLNYISRYQSITDFYWTDSESSYNADFANSNCLKGLAGTNNFLNSNYVYSEETELIVYGRWHVLNGAQFNGVFSSGKNFGFGEVGGVFRLLWGAQTYDAGTVDLLPHYFKINKTGFYVDDVLVVLFTGHTPIVNASTAFYLLNCLGINAMCDFELYSYKIYESSVLVADVKCSQGGGVSCYDILNTNHGGMTSSDYWDVSDNEHININDGFDLWQNSVDSTYLYASLKADDSSVRGNGDAIAGHTWKSKYIQDGISFLPCETKMKLPIESELYSVDTSHFWFNEAKDTAYERGFEEIRAQVDKTYSYTDGFTTYDLSILNDSVSSGDFHKSTFTLYSLGNSITNGIGTTPSTPDFPNSYPYVLEELLGNDGHNITDFVKNGNNGYTTEIMRDMLSGASFTHYDIVTIMLGVNDSFLYKDEGSSISETGDRYYNAMDSCLELINIKLTPNMIIFITPTTPDWGAISGGLPPLDDTCEPYYDEVVTRSLELSSKQKYDNVYLVKGHEAILVGDHASYSDGLHLSNIGAEKLAQYIRDYTTLFINK